jgi:hypothetical protein
LDVVSRVVGVLLMALASVASAAMTQADVDTALDRWQPLITEASRRFSIPAPWIRDVMRAESAGQTTIDGQPTTSSAGAMGLMQIMPGTYAELRERYGLGANPYDPSDNILAGAAYLHELYERYGWPSLFAAYHAGPARFEDYLSTGRPLLRETRAYLATLVPEDAMVGLSHVPPAHASPIFVPLTRSKPAATVSFGRAPDNRLFVRLRDTGTPADAHDGDRVETLLEALHVHTP